MTTKADLIAAFRTAPVPFEVGGQSFHVRPLLVGDMMAVHAYQKSRADGGTAPMVFVRAVCDAGGNRVFDDTDTDMVEHTFCGGVVDAVLNKVFEISRLAEAPQGKAPSTTSPSSNSSSASPGT